jgi:hypothetical protein
MNNPLISLILYLFHMTETPRQKVRWSFTDVYLYSPDTPPCNEYYPRKRDGTISPPILKHSSA